MEKSEKRFYTIGELAANAGVSVRTLQYYDKTGLLKSTLSESGRRTYTRDDIIKLQQILFYKSFGFSLEEIAKKILNSKSASDLTGVFTEQREILTGQMENLNQIVKMLNTVIFETGRGEEVSIEKLIVIMDLMKQGNPYAFVLRYFGDEQLKNITERFQNANAQEKNGQFMKNAGNLFAEMNSLYQKGADPAGAEGQKLAEQWWEMVAEFTEGDPKLLEALVSAGMDIENWPEETKHFQEAIGNFLGAALRIYLANKGLNLSKLEADKDE